MSKYVIQHILCKLLVYLNSYCFYSQVVVLDGLNFWELNGVLALNSAVSFNLTSLQCPKVPRHFILMFSTQVLAASRRWGLKNDEAQDLKSLLQLCLKWIFNSFWLFLPFLRCREPGG